MGSVHGDKALSGSEVYKPGLEAALEALKPGGVLLVYSRCRIARDLMLALFVEDRVKKLRARIEAVSGDPVEGDGPTATMIRQILAAVAEYERKLIAARTKAAMRQHQKNGRKISNHIPFGYRQDPYTANRVLKHAKEWPAVLRAQELRAEGLSFYAIAKQLDAELPGVCRGVRWRPKTVRKVLERIEL